MADQVAPADRAVALLIRVADSDQKAFAELYTAYAEVVRRHLASRGVNPRPADLDEALQEVFLRVWQRRGQYQPCGSGEGYLRAIADRVAGEWRRGKCRWDRPVLEGITHTPPDPAAWGATAVERVAMEHEAAQCVRSAVAGLPEKQRAAVQLCWLEHTPSSAAAEHLHCSTNALKKRLRQAMHLLRARLRTSPLRPSEPYPTPSAKNPDNSDS